PLPSRFRGLLLLLPQTFVAVFVAVAVVVVVVLADEPRVLVLLGGRRGEERGEAHLVEPRLALLQVLLRHRITLAGFRLRRLRPLLPLRLGLGLCKARATGPRTAR